MQIAFYAPLKSPNHPVPSGDRSMARMLMRALELSGHQVALISELRSFSAGSDAPSYAAVEAGAGQEVMRISALWASGGGPDLWFTYHPYYKAPDLLGPGLAARHNIPYVTVETSYSTRRNIAHWEQTQDHVLRGIKSAAVNICLTDRDRDGILAVAPKARLAMLRPFITPTPFAEGKLPSDAGNRMMTVAMMRPGDKFDSYKMLADALRRLPSDLPWSLSIVGDGAMKTEVASLFGGFDPARIEWHGELGAPQIAALMARSSLYVWPGYGEAYGLAYLEAQAAGLPVVAQKVAGVPEAVQHGVTGLLTPAGDTEAFAQAIERLLVNQSERTAMAAAARQFVLSTRSLKGAALKLDAILGNIMGATA
jgi:glycosyltransferase involved in cell wall biosynthesis